MEYYSATKRNEIELFVVRWMELDTDIQSEVIRKTKTNTVCSHIYIESKKKYGFLEPRDRTGIKTQM